MSDRSKLQHQAARGERAQRLLEDPLVVEAFEAIEQKILEGWRESRAEEREQRENAYVMHRLLQSFREHFAAHVRTGELARTELLAIAEEESRLKRMGRAIRGH